MFGFFKKKSEVEILEKKYEDLLKDAHRLSTISRAESDQKTAEAQDVLKQIEALEKNQGK
jgi:hypothetical protein